MTQQEADRFACEWINAWNEHDLERICGHYGEDVEFVSPFVREIGGDPDGRLRGRAALRDYFAAGLARFPDLHFEQIRVLPGVNSVVLHYRSVRDLLAAEMMEFDEAGRVQRVVAHYAPRGT